MTKRGAWGIPEIGLAGAMAMVVVILGGCTSIQSIFSPPPAPKVTVPPPPPAVKREPGAPPPAQQAPEPLPPVEPEAPAANQAPQAPAPTKVPASPAPPVKREPSVPAPAQKAPEPVQPAKKEPEVPPTKKEPETPPPVLAPQVGKGDEEQLKRTASSRIQRAEQLIGQLEGKKLSGDEQERLLTVQSLLGNARDALGAQDLTKASNLADKARILAEELAQAVK